MRTSCLTIQDLVLSLDDSGRCRDHDGLCQLFQRCDSQDPQVWATWHQYDQEGFLGCRQLARLSELVVQDSTYSGFCPSCRHPVEHLPWDPLTCYRPDQSPRLRYLPRRLLGLVTLLPLLFVVPTVALGWHFLRLTFVPAKSPPLKLGQLVEKTSRFVFLQDFGWIHLVVCLLTLGGGAVWLGQALYWF